MLCFGDSWKLFNYLGSSLSSVSKFSLKERKEKNFDRSFVAFILNFEAITSLLLCYINTVHYFFPSSLVVCLLPAYLLFFWRNPTAFLLFYVHIYIKIWVYMLIFLHCFLESSENLIFIKSTLHYGVTHHVMLHLTF